MPPVDQAYSVLFCVSFPCLVLSQIEVFVKCQAKRRAILLQPGLDQKCFCQMYCSSYQRTRHALFTRFDVRLKASLQQQPVADTPWPDACKTLYKLQWIRESCWLLLS